MLSCSVQGVEVGHNRADARCARVRKMYCLDCRTAIAASSAARREMYSFPASRATEAEEFVVKGVGPAVDAETLNGQANLRL